jgi:hypothetical protein
MGRTTFIFRDGALIDRREAAPPRRNRSDLPCPSVISDSLADVCSPITGQPYDSKSAYYAHVRANNCEIVGNDPIASRPPVHTEAAGVEQSIKDAIDQLSA